uniref:Nascent polypeptide-associated complex subunit beta n=1 Tax=Polytomella parva TaxID=51329 RepID=A0A6U0WIK2_9CHLO|mmetsp:Transcript_27913/g.51584  ORF Transcript_27913/g.51584 Transcript_27913/m.51584 type:complete len:151 (+) Transcript_27913:71-523(+)|eukprot:CAMPEP_0175041946 /NCGR_PEP_ID=MMETSP0052_2-20121109/2241_1 /TAXON_ID=51329 ORGANISM="Polytomella parva, Strain SAG 63-3" /NCGR_SAMPLE_ID=MMETSP0052_2 /ASSEMBLY_ACC=CAM_ASM_000194 /LENGTH=150 /DNA_ID=CAMNT_0016304605 /DNA_START=62 /DNA_END=514 /DNA_ORIENTATION=-
MDRDKLMKMAPATRTGGKGSIRRKKKATHKVSSTDDKKLQSTLKRLGCNPIPGIEEVNIFKDDIVINFVNPRVQASLNSNTYVVSGPNQVKSYNDMLPSILNNMGPDSLNQLRRLVEQMNKAGIKPQEAAGGDDDIPELVGENFEEAAKA